MDLHELADRQEITDLLTRYAKAVDRKDWDLYRSLFTADAPIDYTSAGGIKGDLETQVAWLAEALAQFPATQHMVANIDIDFTSPDTATAEAMFHNPMVMDGGAAFTCGGWYHHDMVRTSDGWRSAGLREETAYTAGMPGNLSRPE